MSTTFEQRGQTWVARDTEPSWPILLLARHVYYGTARLPATLTLAREDRKDKITILTSHLDLLIASQRKTFAKEAAARLKQGGVEGDMAKLETSVTTMVDKLLERLQQAQDEISITSVADVALPKDLTPRYPLWPIVPASRPGMLVAPSMMGKSTAALMMSISLVTGHVFIPRIEPRDQGPVLYIGQEETVEQFSARAAMVCRGHQIQMPKHLYVVRLRGGSLIDSAEMLAEMASTRKAKLIVVDSAQATWGQGGDNVREYASRWFNALEQLELPVLVIEHPNLEGTTGKNRGDLQAAGTSVKRDRVGHQWSLKSVAIPPADDTPWRYHVTLSDTKRNYVSQQPDITYETEVYHHDWIRFSDAGALTPDTIINSPSRTDNALAEAMREKLADPEFDGHWQVGELAKLLNAKDDSRIRQSLNADYWRRANWAPNTQFRFAKVPGSGTSPVFDPLVYVFEEEKIAVEMSSAPGGDGLDA